jgi:hypothetical protein
VKNPDPSARKLSGFAYFAYFAVSSVVYIGTVFEPPYFSPSSWNVAIVRRGFWGDGRTTEFFAIPAGQSCEHNVLCLTVLF